MSISPFARPGRVRLQVADLPRSVSYYRDVIGLEVRSQEARHAELAPAFDGDRVLVEIDERPGAAPVPRRANWGCITSRCCCPIARRSAGSRPTCCPRDTRAAPPIMP